MVATFIAKNRVHFFARCFSVRDIQLHAKALREPGAGVLLVNRESPADIKKHSSLFGLMSDEQGFISARFGIAPDDRVGYAFWLDENLRVIDRFALDKTDDLAPVIEAMWKANFSITPRVVAHQAPVITIPNLLPPHICAQAIEYFENDAWREQGKVGEVGMATVSTSNKIRVDSYPKGEMRALLDDYMRKNMFPEVEKVTGVRLTSREQYKIGCYDAREGGFFSPHRDNFDRSLRYRRYAITLNLNDDFEGGELVFPEYGPILYRAATGGATVFPCSLMHKANKVTKGKRYMLVTFFYGEAEAAWRKEYRAAENMEENCDFHRIAKPNLNRHPEDQEDRSRHNFGLVQSKGAFDEASSPQLSLDFGT